MGVSVYNVAAADQDMRARWSWPRWAGDQLGQVGGGQEEGQRDGSSTVEQGGAALMSRMMEA